MKRYVALLLLSFTCTALLAQKGMHMGIKVAPQSTVMLNEDYSDNANYRDVPVWGYAYGLSFDYHFKPTVGVGMDFILSNQGANFEEHTEISGHLTGTNKLRLQYFKLPVLLHFNSNPEKPILFVGQFGPQFGFLTKAKLEVAQNPSLIQPYAAGTSDVKNVYNPVNIGAVLGLGFGTTFKTDFIAMTLQLRFDFAFTDAEKKPEVTDDIDAATKAWYYYFYPNDPELNASERPSTFNTTGGIELGLKYILHRDKKKS